MRSKKFLKALTLAPLAGVVGLAACAQSVDREAPTGTVGSAAWYDEFKVSDGSEEYIIPRHTSCAELGIGNASVTLDGPDDELVFGAGCADFSQEASLDGGDSISVEYDPEGRCTEFSWSSSTVIAGLVALGVDWGHGPEQDPPTTHAWRYAEPKMVGYGRSPAESVDGDLRLVSIEFCYSVESGGDAADAGGGNDNGGGGDAGGGGGGGDDTGGDDGTSTGGGKAS